MVFQDTRGVIYKLMQKDFASYTQQGLNSREISAILTKTSRDPQLENTPRILYKYESADSLILEELGPSSRRDNNFFLEFT
jgi:hypothetical protein